MMNVLLVGENAAGVQTLRALARTGHRIVAVMASRPEPGKGAGSLWEVASTLGYTTWPAGMVKDRGFAERIRSEHIDILLNVHSLFLISKEALEAAPLGGYNLHPGPLPRYAGLNSVCWAIYRGEETHGVTLHKMVPEVDAGPIAYQAFVSIDEHDTGLSLTVKCVQAGVPLVMRLLETTAVNPDDIPHVPQDLTRREYFGKEVPQRGQLDWSVPARRVVNFVRASDFSPFHSPWGHPRTRIGDREIAIVKALRTGEPCGAVPGTIACSSESAVRVACADEWVLVEQVESEGRCTSPVGVLRPGDRLGHSDSTPQGEF